MITPIAKNIVPWIQTLAIDDAASSCTPRCPSSTVSTKPISIVESCVAAAGSASASRARISVRTGLTACSAGARAEGSGGEGRTRGAEIYAVR